MQIVKAMCTVYLRLDMVNTCHIGVSTCITGPGCTKLNYLLIMD